MYQSSFGWWFSAGIIANRSSSIQLSLAAPPSSFKPKRSPLKNHSYKYASDKLWAAFSSFFPRHVLSRANNRMICQRREERGEREKGMRIPQDIIKAIRAFFFFFLLKRIKNEVSPFCCCCSDHPRPKCNESKTNGTQHRTDAP